jgi:hypothetical protein
MIASCTSEGISPELPMHVMHPYPAIVKPSLSKASYTPAFSKYSLTTPDPGDNVVLMYGLTVNPFATAFLATRPAASMTSGFDVFVQEVIAAITTDPC